LTDQLQELPKLNLCEQGRVILVAVHQQVHQLQTKQKKQTIAFRICSISYKPLLRFHLSCNTSPESRQMLESPRAGERTHWESAVRAAAEVQRVVQNLGIPSVEQLVQSSAQPGMTHHVWTDIGEYEEKPVDNSAAVANPGLLSLWLKKVGMAVAFAIHCTVDGPP
jgi:hypothetical protein